MQFPAIIGGVVPVVNLEGVAPGALKLTGPVLADIYLGKIKKWNDKAIADLNPGAQAARGSDHRRASLRRIGHDLHCGPTTCRRSSPEWKDKVGSSDRGLVARGRRRQGQRRRRRVRAADQGLDRLRRIRVREEEQDDLRAASRTATASSSSPTTRRSRPLRPAPTGRARRDSARSSPNQPGKTSWPITGATLHPDARQAGQAAECAWRC